MKRGHTAPSKRLNFDTMELVPVEYPYPRLEEFCNGRYGDRWHVPGSRIMSTKELITLADRRGLIVSITERSGDGTDTTTALN